MAKAPNPPPAEPNKDDKRPAITPANPPGGMAAPPPSLGEQLENQQTDTRPVMGTATTDLNPQPQKGPTIQANEEAGRLLNQPLAGTHEETPSGQQVRPDGPRPATQPLRPDATTQGRRPDVGGSDPMQTHPDNPAMTGRAADAVLTLPETEGEQSLRLAKARAAKRGGNVYLVKRTMTTGHVGHVTESDFLDEETGRLRVDIPWQVAQGTLEPVGDLKADPRMASQLGPDGVREIERLQLRIHEVSADRDRLQEEVNQLQEANKKLRHQLAEAKR